MKKSNKQLAAQIQTTINKLMNVYEDTRYNKTAYRVTNCDLINNIVEHLEKVKEELLSSRG